MNSLTRLVPFASGAFTFFLFELLINLPVSLYLVITFLNVEIFFLIFALTGRQFFKARFWNFLIGPLIFINVGWLFLIFLESFWTQQFLVVILTALIWIFFETVFVYFYFRPKYQAHALENISSYLNLISIFLLFCSLFDLSIFLNYPAWLLSLIAFVVLALATYQIIWVSEISVLSNRRYIAIICLLSLEVFWAVRFLPTSVYVNSSIITIIYYLVSGVSRNWLSNIREPKVLRRYLIISLFSLIIILSTAKWF